MTIVLKTFEAQLHGWVAAVEFYRNLLERCAIEDQPVLAPRDTVRNIRMRGACDGAIESDVRFLTSAQHEPRSGSRRGTHLPLEHRHAGIAGHAVVDVELSPDGLHEAGARAHPKWPSRVMCDLEKG